MAEPVDHFPAIRLRKRSLAAWMAWCAWLLPIAVLVVAALLDQSDRLPELSDRNSILVYGGLLFLVPSLLAWVGVTLAVVGITRARPRLGGSWSLVFSLFPALLLTGAIAWGFESEYSKPDRYDNARIIRSTAERQIVELAPIGRKRTWWEYGYDRKHGFVDRAGNTAIPFRFDFAFPFREGLAVVEIADKYGIIDGNGEWIVPPRFDHTGILYKDGLLAVKESGKWGYLDQQGGFAIPLQFDDAQMFSEGLAAVMVGEGWGYIDMSGSFVIQPQFTYVRGFKEGMAPVYIGGFHRFVTTQEGDMLRMGWQLQGGKWGAIDTEGEVVIQPQYDEPFGFCDGIASVVRNGSKFTIDRSGAPINGP